MIYFLATIISYLIVGALVFGIALDIFAACYNFIHREEIKREAERRIKELNEPYRNHCKARYT